MMLYCSSTCLFGEVVSACEGVEIRNGKLFSLVSVVSGRNVFLNVYEIVFLFPTSLFLSSHKPSHIYEFTTYSRDRCGESKTAKENLHYSPGKYSHPAWRNGGLCVLLQLLLCFSTGKYIANENKQRRENRE